MAKQNCHRLVQKHSVQIGLIQRLRLRTMQRPVGVFDSGVGGLSVLRALQAELPQQRFIYIADSGYAPYGERSSTFVLQRSLAITQHLQQAHDIQALVIACNTATAAAIAPLRSHYAFPIVGIEPALKPALQHSHTRKIGVMATRGTLSSEKFQSLLGALQHQAHYVLQACDGLAGAIERGDTQAVQQLCARYTQALGTFGKQHGAIDTLVLGCTHYPFVSECLRALVGEEVALIDAGIPVARQTRRVLALLTEQALHTALEANATSPQPQFYTTGEAALLQNAIAQLLGYAATVEKVEIEVLPESVRSGL